MGYEPENTLSSFKKAIELGVDMVELDVHICKNGEPVVIHDDNLRKRAWRLGKIKDKTLAELRKYNVGKGQFLPTLGEVIELINHRAIINIELKGLGTAGPVNSLIANYFKRGWSLDDFMISSFNFQELREFRKLNSYIWLGIIFSKTPADIFEFTQEIKAKSIRPSIKCVNQNLIDEAHKRGLKVFVWTANEPKEIQKLKEMGADGIFSDYPDRL